MAKAAIIAAALVNILIFISFSLSFCWFPGIFIEVFGRGEEHSPIPANAALAAQFGSKLKLSHPLPISP